MAEAALRKELRRKKITGYTVQSAGLSVKAGSCLSANSAQALSEAKIPVLKSFKPRQLTEKLIKSAAVVVCMTDAHRRVLAAFENVTSFPALCGIEIPDPYGQDIVVYRATLRYIRECIPRVVELYCPPITSEKTD